MLLYFVNAVGPKTITFLSKCIELLRSFNVKITYISLEVKGVLLYIINAVASQTITFYWNYIYLLRCFHNKPTCVPLKEKQYDQTLQNTVRWERSVALHCKCCSFKDNHFPLRVHLHFRNSHKKGTCVFLKEKHFVQTH